MPPLQGKTAIVTGAGRGVGEATARRLSAAGASVVVNDMDAGEAADCVAVINAAGGEAVACVGDVTAADLPERLLEAALDSFGGIDILINNAGYIWNGVIQNHSDEQWQAMLEVHASAPFRILRALAPWLRETAKREQLESGAASVRKIVNVSSVSGTTGAATQIAYSAGKAAVVGMTKTLAKEWGRYNATVNCVAFGHIDTRLTQTYSGAPPTISVGERELRVGLNEAQIDASVRASPLGRSGQPADGAGAIYLLCLPESDFITGEVLTCSGGAHL
ncbi:MAG: SDR family oxidoreductase [Pseudomonadaceae bacterium]|nr:SDR family oxidoreductase [Pseudomonadaceae bacterium]